jgi:Arc/MetJ-type ribon-helix-helix transcriptional regulator
MAHLHEEMIVMQRENTVMLEAEVPRQVANQMHKLIDYGWYVDEADVLREALRRFLATHGTEVLEAQIREDVAWGLYGKD